jgi:hypothetical protein
MYLIYYFYVDRILIYNIQFCGTLMFIHFYTYDVFLKKLW